MKTKFLFKLCNKHGRLCQVFFYDYDIKGAKEKLKKSIFGDMKIVDIVES
ncbi:MAG: hypothetical protein ACRCX8_08680 [Sarcina sp.]